MINMLSIRPAGEHTYQDRTSINIVEKSLLPRFSVALLYSDIQISPVDLNTGDEYRLPSSRDLVSALSLAIQLHTQFDVLQ
jgi:hypothetical protein